MIEELIYKKRKDCLVMDKFTAVKIAAVAWLLFLGSVGLLLLMDGSLINIWFIAPSGVISVVATPYALAELIEWKQSRLDKEEDR